MTIESSYTKGDTWPPQRFRVRDDNGLVDLAEADDIEVLIRGKGDTVLISGKVKPIVPSDEEGFNAEYKWAEGDLDVAADDYDVEIKVTWDKESTPPKIQTFPNKNPRPGFEIVESNA